MDDIEKGGEDLVELLGILRCRVAMIVTVAGLSLCLALVLLVVIPPRYTATTAILLDPMSNNGLRIGGGEFSSSPVDKLKIESVTALIQSSDFLDQVVKAERLADDPEFAASPYGPIARLLRILTGRSHDNQSEAARFANAEEALGKATTVARDMFTYVIRINVVSSSAAKARALATTIAAVYVKNTAEARIISPPHLPNAPSFPRAKMFLPIGLGVGLVLGILIAVLLERSANLVTTPDQIERRFTLPVLASAPMLTLAELGQGRKRLDTVEFVTKRPFSQFAESIRAIRFGLRHDPKRLCRIVQFASPMPNEGKSTVAACVAASLAIDGMRTILIDCDLRRASPSDPFHTKKTRGVADFLAGLASFEEVLTPTGEPFLRVVPSGKVTHAPPDLANGRRLHSLVQAAAAAADFVIIDSPATEVAVDAAIISQVVDATIIVVKWRSSDRTLVARAIEQIQRAQGRIAGIVLNGIDSKTATYYGYWSKDYVRKTRKYYAAAEARGRAIQATRDAL